MKENSKAVLFRSNAVSSLDFFHNYLTTRLANRWWNQEKRFWKENEHGCAGLQFIDEKNRPRCASISVAEALRTLELLRRILHQSFFWLMLNRLPIKLGLDGDDGHSVNHVDWIDRWAIVVGPPKNRAGQIDEGWSVLLLRKTKKDWTEKAIWSRWIKSLRTHIKTLVPLASVC